MQFRIVLLLPLFFALAAGCSEPDVDPTEDAEAQSRLSNIAPGIDADLLQAEALEGAIRNLYENAGWTAIWSPRAQQALANALDRRARHGLDRLKYLPDVSNLSAASREIALTRAALEFAGALAFGVADPAELHGIYTHPRPQVDLATELVAAARAGQVDTWLDGLAPGTPEYAELAKAYLQQRKAATQENGAAIAGGESIHPGDRDPRIPQVRLALADN